MLCCVEGEKNKGAVQPQQLKGREKKGGGRGAETEVRLKLQCPRSTASVTVLAYDTGRVFLGPGVDVTPAKLCVFLWKGGILGGGFPPV